MSRHTSDDEKRLLPGRWPPYWSPVAPSTGRYKYPSSSSTENGAHAPVLPVYVFELFCQLSAPNSPGRGIVWNVQTFLPVRTSKAMMSPLGNFIDFGTRPFSRDVGITMMSRDTNGGDVFIKWPISVLKLASGSSCFVKSTMPSLPNVGIWCPFFAFRATS